MTKKENMSDKGIDIRLWILSIIAVMSVGFGLGVLNGGSSAKTKVASPSSSTEFTPHHLIFDIKDADKELLESKDRIQDAMQKTIQALDMDLVSSGCHWSDETSSYSCLMAMNEGHGAIQAFPESGVLTIDLAVNDDQSLLPAVEVIQQHFEVGSDVTSLWTIDFRGQPESRNIGNHRMMASAYDILKKELYSGKTKYHKVDIWESKSADGKVLYDVAKKYDLKAGDPRWITNELAPMDVDVYVDGIYAISSDKEEEMDAELDCHPVMLAHPNPKRVSSISNVGDEGKGLQQLLIHDIEAVTIFQPDEELVNIIKTHLPKAFDCSNIDGIADDCLADKLVTWTKENGYDWFREHFGENSKADPAFDVVFADALNPQFADMLADNVDSIFKSLSSDGILGVTLGLSPTILHPRLSYGYYEKYDKLIQALEGLSDVEAVIVYDDDDSLNDDGSEVAPNAWLIACKSATCREEFYASPEVVDSKIASRIVRARDGKKLPMYFDGVVHHGLQPAPKAFETIYCRRDPVPFECNYRNLDFDREIFNYSETEEETAFSIKMDDSNPDAVQSSVIATVDIPSGSYIMAGDLSKSVVVDASVLEEVQGSGEPSCSAEGRIVEIGPSTLIRSVSSEEEANVGQWVPSHPDGQRPKYSPVYDNHKHSFDVFLVATRDISRGEELVRYSRT